MPSEIVRRWLELLLLIACCRCCWWLWWWPWSSSPLPVIWLLFLRSVSVLPAIVGCNVYVSSVAAMFGQVESLAQTKSARHWLRYWWWNMLNKPICLLCLSFCLHSVWRCKIVNYDCANDIRWKLLRNYLGNIFYHRHSSVSTTLTIAISFISCTERIVICIYECVIPLWLVACI